MYIPPHYSGDDKAKTLAFMKRFNFGTIITSVNDVPIATHLPFVISEKGSDIILTSHCARANPHWKEIESNDSLVVFSEPHAYISPTHYDRKENVPTWNYLAVHAYGKAKIIEDQKSVFGILETMMDHFEPAYKNEWKKLSMDYKLRMARGIVAFEIQVTELQSKEKLSQNKTENEQQRIIDSLSGSQDSNQQIVGEYMGLNLKK